MWEIVAVLATAIGIPLGLTVSGLCCRPRPADVILVLGAKTRGFEPGPALKARLDTAVKVYRAGYAPWVMVSGGQGRPGDPKEAEVMAVYLASRGIPPEALVIESASSDTVENIVFSKRLMMSRGWRRAVVVTSAYHLPRALWLARLEGLWVSGRASPPGSPVYTWLSAWREVPAFWRSYQKWKRLRGPV
ncbi:MAG: YdcF family protein [Alicyclobacillaceae bacterium]|nr:YdcF family protein [Alicyclobacillaceae bacterium]